MGGEPTPRAKRSRDGASAPSGSGKRARARDGGGGAEISGDDASAGKGRASSSSKKKRRSSAGPPSARSKRWHPLPVRLDFGSAFSRHVFLRAASSSGGVDGADEGVALFVAAVPPRWTAAHLSELLSTHFGAVEDVSLVTLDAAPDVAGALAPASSAPSPRRRRSTPPAAAPRRSTRPASLAPASSAAARPPRRVSSGGCASRGRAARRSRRGSRGHRRVVRGARARGGAKSAGGAGGGERGRRVDGGGGEARAAEDDGRRGHGGWRDLQATADRRRNDGPKLRENFYRFQQREKRRGEAYELKMRFEADKDRVAKLKASRKFRPT